MRKLNEKCGLFGIFSTTTKDVARNCVTGMQMLQHRGQEGSGLSIADGKDMVTHKNIYLVNHIFTEDVIETLSGNAAIGHNRYSTSAGLGLDHVQPFVVEPGKMQEDPSTGALTIKDGIVALAHNGNLPDTRPLEKFLEKNGSATQGHSDSSLMTAAIGHFMKDGLSVEDAVAKAFPLFTGAFSLLLLTKDTIVALRDAHGIRPLAIGKKGKDVFFASESCAFGAVGATFERDVNPGEMVSVSKKGMHSRMLTKKTEEKLDVFEFVYFARPDSVLYGQSVYDMRRACGVTLAKECPADADIVVPVPETSMPAALGYAQETGLSLELALVKSRYSQRTFIQPDQKKRVALVHRKFAPLVETVKGKRVVIIDDSIVRGTTSRELVAMLYEAGATEVHVRVSSPPVKFPDFYGIDTPKQKELAAAHRNADEVAKFLGATSVCYLSVDGMVKATGQPKERFCLSCFTGEYPIDIGEHKKEITY